MTPVRALRRHLWTACLGASLGVVLPSWAASADPVAVAARALTQQLAEAHPGVAVTVEAVEGRLDAAGSAEAWDVVTVESRLRRQMSVVLKPRGTSVDEPVRVDFRVQAQAWAWKVAQELAPGDALDASLLVHEPVDAIAHPERFSAALDARWRAARRVAAGQVLRPADVVPAGAVLRGEAVNVVYRLGTIEIQSSARVLEPALPGQPFKVALTGRREPMRAVLGDDGRILLTEDRP